MLLNCGVGEDSWASLDCKEIQPVHPKGDQSWVFIGRTDAEAPILWPPDAKNWLTGKDPDAGRLKAEGDDRWDGWMESLTWWTWVWASSGRWWWTGKPGLLQSMGSKRVWHDWETELNWTWEIRASPLLPSTGYKWVTSMLVSNRKRTPKLSMESDNF